MSGRRLQMRAPPPPQKSCLSVSLSVRINAGVFVGVSDKKAFIVCVFL